MRIESLFENPSVYAAFAAGKAVPDEGLLSPAGRGDTLGISDEARAAYEEARLAARQSAGQANIDGQDSSREAEQDGPAGAFREYMEKARGTIAENSGASIREQIEALKKQLEKLQRKLDTIAREDSLSEEGKTSRMRAVNAEIEQVAGRLADLMGRLARDA